MTNLRLGRHTLSFCVGLAMLTACGGHASGGVVPANGTPDHLPGQKTFYYTGSAQTFTVPNGVRYIKVVARGARGAGSPAADGGRVHAVIPVRPGERLIVVVGGHATGVVGGFNGGADGGSGPKSGGHGSGGGGASDVRERGTSLADRIIVSGGGGGAGQERGFYGGAPGGKGGGLIGGKGACAHVHTGSGCERLGGDGGYGGTQYAGGLGGGGGSCFTASGSPGENGALGIGGNGSEGGSPYRSDTFGGGGGGGGYYGGGGGGSGCTYNYYQVGGGGGGGGSSYAESSATDVKMWQGWKNAGGDGLVVFSW